MFAPFVLVFYFLTATVCVRLGSNPTTNALAAPLYAALHFRASLCENVIANDSRGNNECACTITCCRHCGSFHGTKMFFLKNAFINDDKRTGKLLPFLCKNYLLTTLSFMMLNFKIHIKTSAVSKSVIEK